MTVSPSCACSAQLNCWFEARRMFPQPQLWKWGSFNFIGLSVKPDVVWLQAIPFPWGDFYSYFSSNSYIFFMKFVQIMTYLFILIIEDSVFIRLRENLLRWCESFYCVWPQSGLGCDLLLLLHWHGWCYSNSFKCLLLHWTDKCYKCGRISWCCSRFQLGAYHTMTFTFRL